MLCGTIVAINVPLKVQSVFVYAFEGCLLLRLSMMSEFQITRHSETKRGTGLVIFADELVNVTKYKSDETVIADLVHS